MPLDEFDCLVVGNDAAGLWLLAKLCESYKEKDLPTPRMAWVNLGSSARSFLPMPVAETFAINPSETPWSAEIIVPGESFLWSQENLLKKFPNLPFDKFRAALFKTGLSQYTLAHQTIKTYPELLSFASGLWKIFGRSQGPQPETVLTGALACTELFRWDPIKELPTTVETIPVNPTTTPVEEIRSLKQGTVSIKFKDAAPVLAKRVIFNAPLWQLGELFEGHHDFFHLLNIDESLFAKRAHYSLKITAEKNAIPCPLKPLSLYYDVEEIPDIETEVWPFFYEETETDKEITVWATGPREISLEALQERLRAGVGRMNRLFPFLSSSVRGFQVPLGTESCHSPEVRHDAMKTLEHHAIEIYAQSWLHIRSRLKNLFVLGPFVNCHYPYPWGQLQLAQKLLKELQPKPKKKTESPTATPRAPIPLDNAEKIG